MREIKFRAWHKKNKKYYVVFSLHLQAKTVGLKGSLYPYDKVILEQFTGLYDKNGKEIYEGDIVKKGSKHYRIYQSKYYVVFSLHLQAKTVGLIGNCFIRSLTSCFSKDSVVVGNIHENKDLLDEKVL